MNDKASDRKISNRPLSFIFMAFGAPIGKNIGNHFTYSTPAEAGITVGILVAIFGGLGYLIGIAIVKQINAIDTTRKMRVIFSWLSGILGFILYALILGATQQ